MPPDVPSPDPIEYDGWATLRRFLPDLWPSDRPDLRLRIAGALILVLMAKAITLVTPLAMKKVVDTMAAHGSPQLWVALSFVIAFVAARFIGTAFDNTRNIVFERVGQEATQHLAEDTFARLHQLSLRFHLSRRTGEVTKTIERGTKSIDSMLYFLLFNIAPTIVELIAVAFIFYTMFGLPLVIATALTVAVYIFATRVITEWRTALRKQMNDLDGTALARAVDSLLNYETVKYFGAEHRERERYGRAAGAYAEAAIKSENSLGLLNITQSLIMNALMLFALGFTVWQWSKGKLSVGDLVAVQTYLTQLFRPLDMLGMVYRTIRQGLIDMAAMFKLIDTDLEVDDAPGAPALIVRKPTVSFDNVVFGYERDRTILHGLSFEVAAGSQVAVVGPSGAGKSTIARLLFRFYDPWSGRILIDGQDIAQVTQASLRAAIGIVPQDSVLFNDTIGYNIAYGRPGASQEEVERAAKLAQVHDFVQRLP
ncbi:MAG: ABCB family ABC transporter ATP-binding protein/permease, partial [Tsuneonella sp.]